MHVRIVLSNIGYDLSSALCLPSSPQYARGAGLTYPIKDKNNPYYTEQWAAKDEFWINSSAKRLYKVGETFHHDHSRMQQPENCFASLPSHARYAFGWWRSSSAHACMPGWCAGGYPHERLNASALSICPRLQLFLQKLLLRKNKFTGIPYRFERAIMGYDLMNEPRCPASQVLGPFSAQPPHNLI